MKTTRNIFACLLLITGCSQEAPVTAVQEEPAPVAIDTPRQQAPNFLLIIGDDMGKETMGCYGVGEAPANMPTLDSLCNEGVRFDSFWAQPVCSPTRATLLTGNYGFRTGIQNAVWPNLEYTLPYPEPGPGSNAEFLPMNKIDPTFAHLPEHVRPNMVKALKDSRGLRSEEVTLAQLLKNSAAEYATGAFGKWHLADWTNGGVDHPGIAGFDRFSGTLDGTLNSYFAWLHIVDGVETHESGYFTSRMIDDTLAWIGEQETPWFAWVALLAPHEPFHKPPVELLTTQASRDLDPRGDIKANTRPYFLAQLESMDTEIKRLIDGLPADQRDNTYIIFLGDNGSPREATTSPYSFDTVKTTLYEGGVNVPLIVAGPGVATGVAEQLSNSTDLFATILELAGVPGAAVPETAGVDSVSLAAYLDDPSAASARDYIYADRTSGMGPAFRESFTVRNDRYKYVNNGEGNPELFYDLQADPYESTNLLEGDLSTEQAAQLEELKAEATEIRTS